MSQFILPWLGTTYGTGGGSVTILPGVEIHGDSEAGDTSGGGVFQGNPALQRDLAAANMPTTLDDYSVIGSTADQTVAAMLARTTFRKYVYVETWRNGPTAALPLSNPACVAASLAQADVMIAARKPGANLCFGSIMTRCDGTERIGGTNEATYLNILAINAGLAAKSNGTTVQYRDIRSELVNAYDQGDATDILNNSRDEPANSLMESGAAKLHRNSFGVAIAAHIRFFWMYDIERVTDPRTNLINNTVANYTASSATLTQVGDAIRVTGANAFKTAYFTIDPFTPTPRVMLLRMDWTAFSGNISAVMRRFDGSDYAPPTGWYDAFSSNPYNPSSLRRSRRDVPVFANVNNTPLQVAQKANNDAAADWTFRYDYLHAVT